MNKQVDNQPLATVNGHVIYAGALSREIEQLSASVHGIKFDSLSPAQRAELKKSAITKLIREELVMESELAAVVQPTEAEIKAELDEVELSIRLQGGDDLADDEGFQKRLHEKMSRELVIHHVIDLFLSEVEISDQEIEGFYNFQNKKTGISRFARDGRLELAEIFLSTETKPCPAGRSALILALRSFKERFEAGETFADLAMKHSENPKTAANGGRIGWVRRGEIKDELFDAASVTAENDLTDAILTSEGYVMMQVLGRDLTLLSLDEVKDEIRAELSDAQAKAAFKDWVAQLTEKADIRIGGDPSTWE